MAITIQGVRFSYCNLFQPHAPRNDPNGDRKYSVTLLIPKSNITAFNAVCAAMEEAAAYATAAKWNNVRPPILPNPLHDGDGTRQDGTPYGEECKGMWILTASCKENRPPFVVDQQVQPIIDPRGIYSGCWGNASVNFFGYFAAGKKGIGCGLNGVQLVRQDEPLGGGTVTAEQAFQPVPMEPQTVPQAWGAPAPQAAPQAWGAPAPQTAPQGWGAPAPQTAPQGWGAPAHQTAPQAWGGEELPF